MAQKNLSRSGGSDTEALYDKLLLEKRPSSFIYNLRPQDNVVINMKIAWWSDQLNCDISEKEFVRAVRAIYTCTNYPKLRAFQYRLLFNALILNIHLYRWGLREDNKCSFCGMGKETLIHIFQGCTEVQSLWDELLANCIDRGIPTADISFTPQNILFNNLKHNVCNTLCLLLKHYVYRQRCTGKPICRTDYRHYCNRIENMEKFIAIKNGHLSKHNKKWHGKLT